MVQDIMCYLKIFKTKQKQKQTLNEDIIKESKFILKITYQKV